MMQDRKEEKNDEGRNYWGAAWNAIDSVQSFSPHTTVVEETKWRYLCNDLSGRSSGRALEVGCGTGHIGSLLADLGFDVVLLDYLQAALECAKRSFTFLGGQERKTYILGNALDLPLADGSFDVVISCGLLEHFEDADVVIKEMARVLQAGGLFYSDICPRKFSLVRMIEMLKRKSDGWYEAKMGKKEVRRMVEKAGLEIIRVFSAGVLPPRSVPGTGRFKLFSRIEKFLVCGLKRFWCSLDGTPVADWLGFYYYVTARKPSRANHVKAAISETEQEAR